MSGPPSEIRYRLVGYMTAPLIVASYLSKGTQDELDRAGLNYYSAGDGRLKFVTDTWPVYEVEVSA